MKRWIFFAYGIFCHLLFLATFACLAAFIGGFMLPKTIDAPASRLPLGVALAIDSTLLLLFGVQHSLMARPAFKKIWTRFIPPPIERSTYVLASCLVTILLMVCWQPIDRVLWQAPAGAATVVLYTLFGIGWLMVPVVSLMIHHFDLFGTRQVWLYLRNRPYIPLPFRTPWMYKHMRHPLYVGWAIAFWATPTMTLAHALLAAVWTGYMLLAALVEERDLIDVYGERYRQYCREVPRYVPRLRRNPRTDAPLVMDSVAAEPAPAEPAIR